MPAGQFGLITAFKEFMLSMSDIHGNQEPATE
jgi:hypothetical protein